MAILGDQLGSQQTHPQRPAQPLGFLPQQQVTH